jgi:hypothetical protein
VASDTIVTKIPSGDEILEIGNPITFNARTDPNNIVNNKFIEGMNVVELIPIDYEFDLSNWGSKKDEIKNKPPYILAYDFKKAIEKYEKLCKSYDLEPKKGLRIFLTGDSVHQETITNAYSASNIQTYLNRISDFGNQFGKIRLKELGQEGSDPNSTLGAAKQFASTKFKELGGTVGSMFGNAGAGTLVASSLANMFLEGTHFSLPKVWKESSYSPSLAFNVQLISPYGNEEYIKKFVLEPLIYLLLLGSPTSKDGLTYGNPKYVFVKSYGISNINIGVLESITLNRGGADMTFNANRQPTSINLNISIKPAFDGFASVCDTGGNTDEFNTQNFKIKDIATMNDFGKQILSVDSPGPAFTTVGNIIRSFEAFNPQYKNSAVPESSKTSQPNIFNTQDIGINNASSALNSALNSSIASLNIQG